jgi:arylsulfatase A-like enzyme
LGIAAPVGALYGAGASVPLQAFARGGRRGRAIGFALTAVLVALFVANGFNAITALDGPTRSLALASLGASLGVGLYVALLGLALIPTRTRPKGWVQNHRWRTRWLFLVLAAGALGATTWADRNLWRDVYPLVHAFLQWLGWLNAFFILAAVWPRLHPKRWFRIAALALLVLLTSFPLLTLTEEDQEALYSISRHPFSARPLFEMRLLTDFDADGYSSVLGGTDCAPFNSQVSPGTQEIPANGIDDDCYNGDANYVGNSSGQIPVPKEVSPVSVVLITIDTLRPDRMTLYGAKRETTPQLDKWAKSAMVFERAYAGGAWTSLSLTSLFRGVYPRRVQWTWVYETTKWRLVQKPFENVLKPGETAKKAFAMPVDDPRPPLAWYLKRRGMRTHAVVDDGHSMFLDQQLNIAGKTAFDSYFIADELPKNKRDDVELSRKAISELRKFNKSPQPFFLWTHFFGPHSPSKKHKGTVSFGDGFMNDYDHEIAYLDKALARLLREVDRLAKTREVVVVVTADHGERIWKHFRGHGGDVLEQNVRVPLIIRGPGISPGRTKQVVSLVDLFPTIMGWTRTPGPDDIDGVDLVELLRAKHQPRTVITETWRFSRSHARELDLIAAVNDTHKLTWNLKSEARSLKQIGKHFDHKKNLIEKVKQPDLQKAMNAYLERNRRVHISE